MYDELLHKDATIGVIGLGVTGKAAVRFAVKRCRNVLVSDSREETQLVDQDGSFLTAAGVEWESGGHTYEFLRRADLLLVSPGVPEDHAVLSRLKAEGKPLLGELAVAAGHLKMPVVAVTGTNGKTTVTSLIGELIRSAGKDVFVGGNIGMPIYDFIDSGAIADVAVLEVSSFQLLLAGDFSPDIGVLLNITPDHLDRHKTLSGYGDAKMNLFARQNDDQQAILALDDPECAKRLDSIGRGRGLSFGSGSSCDMRVDGDTIISRRTQAVYQLQDTALAGPIGVLNSAAAILAVETLGIAPDCIRDGLKRFQPGPHRLQLVNSVGGVRFVNDSKGTNTGAVIAALGQLTSRAILIAGGRDKGEDYQLLRDMVAKKARAVVVIGEAGPAIAEALGEVSQVHHAESMEEAVRKGYVLAEPGDTVLLSPACASFDMFRSYGHRGEVFEDAVKRLAEEIESGEGYGND